MTRHLGSPGSMANWFWCNLYFRTLYMFICQVKFTSPSRLIPPRLSTPNRNLRFVPCRVEYGDVPEGASLNGTCSRFQTGCSVLETRSDLCPLCLHCWFLLEPARLKRRRSRRKQICKQAGEKRHVYGLEFNHFNAPSLSWIALQVYYERL
jgi:hypothetical protein